MAAKKQKALEPVFACIQLMYWPRASMVLDIEWPWRNFTPDELCTPDTGELLIDPGAVNKLQEMRDQLDLPLVINSAYRSAFHNRSVGGERDSQHLKGRAFDISLTYVTKDEDGQSVIRTHDREAVLAAAKKVGFTGFGFYGGFLHVDVGPERTWGQWT